MNLSDLPKQPSWVRIPLFFLILLSLWLPIALPVYLIWYERAGIGLVIFLYVLFVGLIGWWGRQMGYSQPYREYGLSWSGRSGLELCLGLLVALVCFAGLMGGMVGWGWLAVRTVVWWRAIPEGLMVGLGVSLAEELLFRGWLLQELLPHGRRVALWASSLIFALLHFLKPLEVILRTWVQFPGLVLLGLVLVWGRWGYGNRLSMPIGIHWGLVWGYYVVNTTGWLTPTGTVSAWVTGIDGNPLAGAMGLLCLGLLGIIVKLLEIPELDRVRNKS
ncbi:MAG: type II CAAX prenyl endopeptidase Rce1 family protein [Pseudanabaenaceae cyanobacterium]